MKTSFEIDRSHLLTLVRQELETSQSFQKNIDGAVQHFLTNPYNAQGFTDSDKGVCRQTLCGSPACAGDDQLTASLKHLWLLQMIYQGVPQVHVLLKD